MEASRIKNSKRNIIASYAETAVNLVFQFVSRTIIVYALGDEYLGLSSLFSSILQILNMAEMGFSVAVVFNMYKPLAEGNTAQINRLLAYYRKIYTIIGGVIFLCGLAIMPFLPVFIKAGIPADTNLYVLFFLYLLNTCLSYVLFAYKTALLNALQRLDLTKIVYLVVNIVQYSLQIISLLAFKNYYIFLIISIFGTAAKNLFAAFVSQKKFPQYFCEGEIDRETRDDIKLRVKGLLISSISSTTYTTFDSIILSSFIGLSVVAIYNNYLAIYSVVTTLLLLIRNAIQASVGNSIAVESVEKNYSDMLLWQFLFSVIATWCATCLFSLYQPFMTVWMGAERLLPLQDVAMLCILAFVAVVQHAFYLYIAGTGMWFDLKWPYILSTIVNLAMNIILGKLFGTTGVIFSTVFVNLIFSFFWQSKILFKNYFRKSVKQYQLRNLAYFLVCIVSGVCAYLINNILPVSGIPGLIIRLLVCTVVSVVIMFAFYCRTKVFKDSRALFYRVIRKSS